MADQINFECKNYSPETLTELRYRVVERLGILYENKDVTQEQIQEVVKQVEKDFN